MTKFSFGLFMMFVGMFFLIRSILIDYKALYTKHPNSVEPEKLRAMLGIVIMLSGVILMYAY